MSGHSPPSSAFFRSFLSPVFTDLLPPEALSDGNHVFGPKVKYSPSETTKLTVFTINYQHHMKKFHAQILKDVSRTTQRPGGPCWLKELRIFELSVSCNTSKNKLCIFFLRFSSLFLKPESDWNLLFLLLCAIFLNTILSSNFFCRAPHSKWFVFSLSRLSSNANFLAVFIFLPKFSSILKNFPHPHQRYHIY